jgi:hypothetical protein
MLIRLMCTIVVMRSLRIILLCFIGLLMTAAAPATRAVDTNDVVLSAARSFKDGGGYVKSGGSGTPEEVRFKSDVVLPRGTGGTYCSGFTFAVVMRAANELKLLEGKSLEQIKKLQQQWYGAVPDSEMREKQCPLAMEKLGVGKTISHDEARAGDFCQFWRTSKTGHSVVFLKWIEKDGQRIGLRYRSSQELTKGVGDRTECFADTGIAKALVIRERMYFGRLHSAAEKE